MSYSRIQQFSIVFAFIMITWGLLPFFNIGGTTLNNNTLATSTILFLIGIAYPIIIFIPEWKKAILLVEGIIFASVGAAFLEPFFNLYFLVIGILFIVVSVLAYAEKLPRFMLRFFKARKR